MDWILRWVTYAQPPLGLNELAVITTCKWILRSLEANDCRSEIQDGNFSSLYEPDARLAEPLDALTLCHVLRAINTLEKAVSMAKWRLAIVKDADWLRAASKRHKGYFGLGLPQQTTAVGSYECFAEHAIAVRLMDTCARLCGRLQ